MLETLLTRFVTIEKLNVITISTKTAKE